MNHIDTASESAPRSNRQGDLLLAAVAAFCVYFCMYAFRKPFSAALYEGETLGGYQLKSTLVLAQLIGYALSKVIGIKVVSEMRKEHRATAILLLILVAEAALVGFAVLPMPLKPVMLFINGLPLGMIFGLVLAYLEGRRQTEAMTAALCASFIVSSGVVKTVGRLLVDRYGVSEFVMPMATGLVFLPPLFVSVWMLQRTPAPDQADRQTRNERSAAYHADRRRFVAAYWPGLVLLLVVYVALTVARTVRDDFNVEIWRDMGVEQKPAIFAWTEGVVALCVVLLNALAIWISHHLAAIRVTIAVMLLSFVLVVFAAFLQTRELVSPLTFMVGCGVGLYVPYVAFHTTIFERMLALSRHPANLGFLMYLADSVGYVGYGCVLLGKTFRADSTEVLPMFRATLVVVTGTSIVALVGAVWYFHVVMARDRTGAGSVEPMNSQ